MNQPDNDLGNTQENTLELLLKQNLRNRLTLERKNIIYLALNKSMLITDMSNSLADGIKIEKKKSRGQHFSWLPDSFRKDLDIENNKQKILSGNSEIVECRVVKMSLPEGYFLLWMEKDQHPLEPGIIITLTKIPYKVLNKNPLIISNYKKQVEPFSCTGFMWEWTPEENIFLFSQGLILLLNYEKTEIEENLDSFLELIHPADRVETRQNLIRVSSGTMIRHQWEFRIRKKQGSWLWGEISANVIEWHENKTARKISGIVSDITKWKQMSRELNQYRFHMESLVDSRTRFLEQSNNELRETMENLQKTQHKLLISERMAALGNLVTGISHEVNTPLGVAGIGASHLVYKSREMAELYKKEKLSQEEFEEFLTNIQDAAESLEININKAAELLKSLKTVSADRTSQRTRQIYLHEYLKEIIVCLGHLIKQKPVNLRIDCPKTLKMRTIPGALSQIFTNLIQNSLIHAFKPEEKGTISIIITEDNNNLTILYSDDGNGIPAHVLNKIWDPFFTTRIDDGGTGLGLNLIHTIITENLAGTIRCNSRQEEGTTFTITLPFDRGDD